MHTIELPRSKDKFTFRAPTVEDRREMLKTYQGKELGLGPEDVLAIRCIEAINNRPVEEVGFDVSGDPYSFMNDYPMYDLSYYVELFAVLYLIDEEGRRLAAETAKELMGALQKSPVRSGKKATSQTTSTT
jgi:hypothetical protein